MDVVLPESHVSDAPSRRSLVSLQAALVVSLLLHGVGAIWWSQQPDPISSPRPEPAVIELTLELPPEQIATSEPSVAAEIREPEPQPPEPLNQPDITEPRLEPDPPLETQIVQQAPEVPSEEPPPPLRLDRPDNWDDYLGISDESFATNGLPFNRKLGLLRAEAEASRSRRQLLTKRKSAVAGLSDEAFGSLGGLDSELIKVDGQCFTLRPSEGLGSEPQWWATQCKDPHQNALTLKRVEYDAVGRIVAD